MNYPKPSGVFTGEQPSPTSKESAPIVGRRSATEKALGQQAVGGADLLSDPGRKTGQLAEAISPFDYGHVVHVSNDGRYGFVDVSLADGTRKTMYVPGSGYSPTSTHMYRAYEQTGMGNGENPGLSKGKTIAVVGYKESADATKKPKVVVWTTEAEARTVDGELCERARRYPVGLYFYPEHETEDGGAPDVQQLWSKGGYKGGKNENTWLWVCKPGEFPHGEFGWSYGPKESRDSTVWPNLGNSEFDPLALQFVEGMEHARKVLVRELGNLDGLHDRMLRDVAGWRDPDEEKRRITRYITERRDDILAFLNADASPDYGTRNLKMYPVDSHVVPVETPEITYPQGEEYRTYVIDRLLEDAMAGKVAHREYTEINRRIALLQDRTTRQLPTIDPAAIREYLQQVLPSKCLSVRHAAKLLPVIRLDDLVSSEERQSISQQSPKKYQGYDIRYKQGIPFVELRDTHVEQFCQSSAAVLPDGREVRIATGDGDTVSLRDAQSLLREIKQAAKARLYKKGEN